MDSLKLLGTVKPSCNEVAEAGNVSASQNNAPKCGNDGTRLRVETIAIGLVFIQVLRTNSGMPKWLGGKLRRLDSEFRRAKQTHRSFSAHCMQVMGRLLLSNGRAFKEILAELAGIRKDSGTIGLCHPVRTLDHEVQQRT